jgi:hypothetical protein
MKSLTEIQALRVKDPRVFDVEVARYVHGIKKFYGWDGTPWDQKSEMYPQFIPSGKPWKTHEIDARYLPRFGEDANADLLSHRVACGWGEGYGTNNYFSKLGGILRERLGRECSGYLAHMGAYQVGDFSLCALAVVMENENE